MPQRMPEGFKVVRNVEQHLKECLKGAGCIEQCNRYTNIDYFKASCMFD